MSPMQFQTIDGNYISVSKANATSATWIVRKVTPLGKMIWEKTLSQVAHGYWSLQSIAQTNDGYVLVGSAYDTEPGESLSAAIVVALHPDGTINWTKRFGITTSFGASAAIGFTSVTSTADGGFIVTGWAYEVPFLLLKFVQDGNIQWQKALSLHQVEDVLSQSTADNGLILAGRRRNGADVVKVDLSGNILWKKTLSIEGFGLQALGYAPSNGVVIVGTSTGSSLLLLTGLDSNGKIVWRANYKMEAPFSISRIVPTTDGGYVVTGSTKSKSGFYSGFLLKIDAQKHLVFQRTFGARSPKSIFATTEGGFIVFGGTGYDLLFLSLNSDGIVPNCPSFHNLNSKAVPKSAIKVGSSNVSSQSVTLSTQTAFDLTSKSSRHSMSTICQ